MRSERSWRVVQRRETARAAHPVALRFDSLEDARMKRGGGKRGGY